MKRIDTIELFPDLSSALIILLKELNHSSWNKPSPVKDRTVKDIVSHLIDSSLRRLSIQRDRYTGNSVQADIRSYDELIRFIQVLNKEWMRVTDRLSPEILIDLLEYSEAALYEFFKTLDPEAKAIFPVQWAGHAESKNWFDIAREYTEKWHHQMQIRIALDKPLLMHKKFIKPLYDTFMVGLPHLYRELKAYPSGETIEIKLTGSLNKCWYLEKKGDSWVLVDHLENNVTTRIQFPEDDAWKIFTNTDRDKEKYISKLKIDGNTQLGLKLLDFVTVLS